MWSLTSLLFPLFFSTVKAEVSLPRSTLHSGPPTLPLHFFAPRSGISNETSSAGITQVTLSSDGQSYYTVLNVGSISFRVDLDTASSDLWIVSSACTTKTCENVPRYPLSYESPTFISLNANSTPFEVSYLDGTVASGYVTAETISMANLTLSNQTFGMITNSNVTLVDETSGILGLGFPRLSSISATVANLTPFFPSLAQQGLLEYPLFGLSLAQNTTGTLSIGAVDASVIKNASLIGWNRVVDFEPFGSESNVSSYLQWAIPMSAYAVNGTQLQPTPTYPNMTGNVSLALFDIGTPGIYGPMDDVAKLFSAIDGARLVDESGQWALPCDTVEPMSFTFGSQNYTLEASDYMIGSTSGDPNLCLAWPRGSSPSADGIDWQIGTAFLRTVYSIFSYGINAKEPPYIGLYSLRNATAALDTSNSSAFSTVSSTIATTLPNYLLPTPTFTTPPYAFNASVGHLSKGIATSGLAPSTYRPILGTHSSANITALPEITASADLVTFIVTDSGGALSTSTSTVAPSSVTLGVPPGWNAGTSVYTSSRITFVFSALMSWTLIYIANFVV